MKNEKWKMRLKKKKKKELTTVRAQNEKKILQEET